MNTDPNPTIVIIEGQPLSLTAFSATLAAEGMNVLAEVQESAQAIQTIQRLRPRLTLFSVGSPALPDLERISALRHELPNVMILALMNDDFPGLARMALDYGAHRVLARTTPRTELISALRELAQETISISFKKEA